MRRPARNSSPSRGTPVSRQRGLQPGRQTPGHGQLAAARTEHGEGVGCADRPGTPLPLKGRTGACPAAWPSARTASAWPGGGVGVTGSHGEVKVWDAQTGQELLYASRRHTPCLTSVAFSPDGKRLASASRDGDQVGEGVGCADRPGTPLPQGRAAVHGVAFSPDGKRLASGHPGGRHGARCGMRRPARNSSPSRGTPTGSRAWPSARTASAWPALLGRRHGEGVGCRRPARNSSPSRGTRIDQQRGLQPGRPPAGQRRRGRHGEDLGRHAAAGEAVTARGPTRRTDANAGGGSGPRSPPPPCSRTMSQPGDGPWFVPASSYVSSERPQTTLCRDAVLAWPSSSRLPVEPTAPAATPAWARWVEAMGTEPRSSDDRRSGAGSEGSQVTPVGHHPVSSRQRIRIF